MFLDYSKRKLLYCDEISHKGTNILNLIKVLVPLKY